jgi:hypothetical protein
MGGIAASQHFHLANVGSGSCVTRIVGPNGGTYRTIDEGRSFEAGSPVTASNRCKLLSSVRWPITCAMQHGLLLWVKSTNYRAAASLSALPSISRPRQEGFDATLSAKTGREQMQQSRALFDKLVGGGKQ